MLYYGIKPQSLGQLGALASQVKDSAENKAQIAIKFLRPYGVAFLDQLGLQIRESRKRTFSMHSAYPEVNRYFKQTEFKHLTTRCSLSKPFPQNDIIRVKRFLGKPLAVEPKVVRWLTRSVKPFLPEQSPKLWKKIVENLWEIVHNGLQHGENKFGISTCGQFYPRMGYFEVAFYDMGHGIPKLVRQFKALPKTATDCECINWAVQEGNSTRPMKEPAGLGLHLLRQFLRLNGGFFQMVSGNGYYGENGQEAPSILTLKNSIDGTLVNIRVIFDGKLYKLKGEKL